MMELRIADTFSDSLARLTGDEQRASKTTTFDLHMDPATHHGTLTACNGTEPAEHSSHARDRSPAESQLACALRGSCIVSDWTSPQESLPDPPASQEGATAWGRWAETFLDRLCEEWAQWRRTCTVQEEEIYSRGNPDAWSVLDREPRLIRYSRKWLPGRPLPELSRAVQLLDALFAAAGWQPHARNHSAYQPENNNVGNECNETLPRTLRRVAACYGRGICCHRFSNSMRIPRLTSCGSLVISSRFPGVGPCYAFFFVFLFRFRAGFGGSSIISSRSPGVMSRARQIFSIVASVAL